MTTSHARTYNTIAEIKRANRDAGQHFFDTGAMHFFHSRVLRGVIGGRFFITSERYDMESPRMFTVREADDHGHVSDVGEFQQHNTAAQARSAARRAAAMSDTLSDIDTIRQAGECARCNRWSALRLYDTTREDEGGCAWLCEDCQEAPSS